MKEHILKTDQFDLAVASRKNRCSNQEEWHCQGILLYFGKSHDPMIFSSWDCTLYFWSRPPLTRILPKTSSNLGMLYIRIQRWSVMSFSKTQICLLTAPMKLSPIQSCFQQHIVFRDLASYFLIQSTHLVEHPILDC